MIELNITDETSQLKTVILGMPEDFGGTPKIDNVYDPKSRKHILNGTFPSQFDIINEMNEFCTTLEKHGVTVLRPENIIDLNQVFARDIAFVIEDKLVIPHIISDRTDEIKGIKHIIDQIPDKNKLFAPEGVRIEGGDVMPWRGQLFVGYSKDEDFNQYKVSRTNEAGIEFLRENFRSWEVVAIELNKSDSDPKKNALHLDCCFQPVGDNNAILHKEGFKNQQDFEYLLNFFGQENCLLIDSQEMYDMNSNIFSINPKVVVSDKSFTRLNNWLRNNGIEVEEINYREIAKMEGLLRCSTLPLLRKI